jgi:hypothetical protein
LRPRNGREAIAPLDSIDVHDVGAKLALISACRNYAGELAVSEATRRVHSEREGGSARRDQEATERRPRQAQRERARELVERVGLTELVRRQQLRHDRVERGREEAGAGPVYRREHGDVP